MGQLTESELRQQVIDCAKQLTQTGLAIGTAGNVSVRISDCECLITPTGVSYELLQQEDICKVSFESDHWGESPSNGQSNHRGDGLSNAQVSDSNLRKPSSETPMHTRVYLARPDVGAVVHTHSLYATALAVAGRPILPVHYVIATLGDEIPVVPYYVYGSTELADAVGRAVGQVNGLLLQNHGVMAVGKDLQEAFYHAQTIEYLAQLMYTAEALGEPKLLSPSQLNEVRLRFRGYGQQQNS